MLQNCAVSSLLVLLVVVVPPGALSSILTSRTMNIPFSMEVERNSSSSLANGDIDGALTKKKRDIFNGVFDELISLFFRDKSDTSDESSDQSDEKYLICRNCTVNVNGVNNTDNTIQQSNLYTSSFVASSPTATTILSPSASGHSTTQETIESHATTTISTFKTTSV